ncbi:MAG TPA: DNA ligase D [Candidatus Saccharimonadia bacterium]|nr:DNA ligase D [Candidatus Saccharimonadia bacterium]
MPLKDYHAKRKFDQTPEPTGGSGEGPLRFVVQKHHATALHYDFRLEMGGVLKSWAVPKGPSLNPQDKRLAMMTEDHPYDYRTFEGVIPEGNYGAGPVIVWDEGTYEPLFATGDRDADDKLARAGVHKEHLTFILHGQKLNGEFALIKMHGNADENAWLIVKAHKDKFVSASDITAQNRSVVTNRTIEETAAGKPITKLHLGELTTAPKAPLPNTFEPMLATLAEHPFDDPAWIYEIKWDGYRIMAELGAGGVTLHTRGGQDYTQRFKIIADELHHLRVPALIDGEITVVDPDGRSSFQALQNYLRTGQGRLLYYAFDLLHLAGHDLTNLPLASRKALLRRILPPGPHLRYSDHIAEQGTAMLAHIKEQGMEGIIAKRADSLYRFGHRSRDWLKLKTKHRQEAVIVGYTAPRAGRHHFGALVLGIYDHQRLVYAGHTGSGFTDASLQSLHEQLQPLVTTQCPIDPAPQTNEPATWVRPKLVAEVEFTEWTEDGSMRHPIFGGLREDKPAAEVHREQAINEEPTVTNETTLKLNGHTVPITHRDKLYWPEDGITKGQLIEYYRAIAPTILPYLTDRPESLNRFPHGIHGDSFYQKDLEDHPAWAKTTLIHSESANKDINYLLCQNEATLIYMANLGCIDLNPWNSRLKHLDNPDWCVIDLDPEDIGFEAVIETARAVKSVLDKAKIPCYPKTSGATGIHIYIPMGAKYPYEQVKDFAHIIARLVNAQVPKLTSVERNPAKRQHKVYLDYLQNRHGQTLAAPYSVRPRPGAPVSTPLRWDEVKPGLQPTDHTIHTTTKRLEAVGDLWAPVLGPGIDLAAALGRL